MVAAVNTSVPVPGGTVNAPGQEQQTSNTFFGPLSSNTLSHIFTVDESPYYIKAFGLGDANEINVLMTTQTSTGEVMEQMYINGAFVALTKLGNFLLIDFPGSYRLQLNGGGLGSVIVVGGATALSYWSWGLAAFGKTRPQT